MGGLHKYSKIADNSDKTTVAEMNGDTADIV